GTNRRDVGAGVDNRQGVPEWTADSSAVLFTVQDRGTVRLYRMPVNGGKAEIVVNERGTVGSFSARKNTIAYTLATPGDQAALYVTGRRMTDLNAAVLRDKPIAEVEAFTFVSNDNKFEVEAFLTKPIGLSPTAKYPMIVNI